jgi:hypothetical protein
MKEFNYSSFIFLNIFFLRTFQVFCIKLGLLHWYLVGLCIRRIDGQC